MLVSPAFQRCGLGQKIILGPIGAVQKDESAPAISYTDAWQAGARKIPWLLIRRMAETRIKPHLQQVAEKQRREEQRRVYRRNQIFGLLILAAAVCAWWLWHTGPGWVFPPGWWRP